MSPSSSKNQGGSVLPGFSAFTFRMGCNGGGFINSLSNKVFWVFSFGNIIQEPVFHDFFNDAVCHGLCRQVLFSCIWVTVGPSGSFFL